MQKRRYSEEEKAQILTLVESGLTYAQIQGQYGFPKSTISYILAKNGRVLDRSRQIAHLKKARVRAVEAIQEKRKSREDLAFEEAKRVQATLDLTSESVGKALLAMLYWGEGGKTIGPMKFTNTDPELVLLFLNLLRRHYRVDEGRLRIGLQIHPYHNEKELVEFWSTRLSIPVSQFWKVYIKQRSGKRKEYRRNFYGICNLHYSSTAIQRELMALGREVAAKASV